MTYLPGHIFEYFNISKLTISKERIYWLIVLLSTYEMNEISDQFYELLISQSEKLKDPALHPYGIDWSKYDQLQNVSQIEAEVH